MKGELRRTVGVERKFMGVCGGIAKFFGIDPTIVRVLMVCIAVWGPGIIIYIACMFIMPEDDGTFRADYTVKHNCAPPDGGDSFKSDGSGKNGWN